MGKDSSVAVGGKADLRDTLDLRGAEWRRVRPDVDTVEYSFVPHTDGVTYVAMRQSPDPGGLVLVFTPSEWDAFLAGVRAGEFDQPR
ncbi:DUF397 domain-containing protein [Saccharomonospora sp. NPDC046836]|uniref:DUF397 domain-containing protein n=1 Tax=Saccharomonospora sp. NPDC046836 TaxID=3156921 RepID=UPI0033EE6821